ncbi:glycolipid transfer protein [Coprinellus micaceus]|uniref:Glycolipid transfer protein n=1 Tax=Coprinellus micaceus TaxID=71717 RepID=A0A4Y7SSR2_COPMI|nr:glycolipid transfer protein [Coprinellus micaceus]
MAAKPHFESVKSFAEVPITDVGVDSGAFLEASDGLVQMFDLFGSGVFGFVQMDLRSNINGVRSRYEGQPDSSGTLEELRPPEGAASSTSTSQKYATACLVRLRLPVKPLQNMQSDHSSELHVLRHHHSFIIRSVVSVAIRAVPRRTDFYHRLSQGAPSDKFDEELGKWLSGLDVIVKRISEFLSSGGYGRV